MEISIDREKVDLRGARPRNLEEVLEQIMAEHIQPGRYITGVKYNGADYSENQTHDAAKIPVKEIETLEIESQSSEEVARHFLKSGGKQLDFLVSGAQKIAELFRVSDENEANEWYAEYLENLRLFLQMISECQEVLGLNFTETSNQGFTVEDRIHQLSSLIDQMLKVQEEEDWVVLADLLEFELIPLLKGWKEILVFLHGQGRDS
jgi:hypothetical protein